VEHLEQLGNDLTHDILGGQVEDCNELLLVLGVGDNAFESLFGLLAEIITCVLHQLNC